MRERPGGLVINSRSALRLALISGGAAILIGTLGGARADEASATAARVKAALIAAGIGNARHIDVQAFNGEADLTGVVYSEHSKDMAIMIAGQVPGVTSIGNFLEVQQQADADVALAGKVRDALAAGGIANVQQLDVEVFNGEADLGGVVHSATDKQNAASIAGAVRGITAVWNDLQVR
jgi:osmotically-inducible protein OsmY